MSQTPPKATTQRVSQTLHGRERVDDYAWLKDERWQDVMRDPSQLSADIRTYLEQENAFTADAMADSELLQETLFNEFRGRIKEDDSSVPARDGSFEYYVRFREGGQQPMVCRRPNDDADNEQVLLDGDSLAESESYFHLGDHGHSRDHRLFAWSQDTAGSEFYSIHVRDLDADSLLPDVIPDASGSFEWVDAGSDAAPAIAYTVLDANHRPCKVLIHRLGADAQSDAVIYEEADAGFFVGVELSRSRDFLFVDAHDHVTSEVRYLDLRQPKSVRTLELVAPRRPGVEYSVDHHDDRLLILTNADDAEDFKIVSAPLHAPGHENWTDLIPHRAGVLIVGMQVLAKHLIRLERVDGLPRIVVHEFATGEEHCVSFPEEAYSLGLGGGYEFDTPHLRFVYSSMTTPEQVYDYHLQTRDRTLLKTQEVPSGHDPERFVTRRVFANARDGERVPISLLHLKSTAMDGTAPMLLTGYGAYGISLPAAFSTSRLSLVERGFVYAIAHVRGGMERGYRWYRQGKLQHKKNSFEDFIASAEHLVATGVAAAERVAVHGGSAGGLLMGAVTNLRPDLFAAVVADVPFVDVLNTMCDATLPLTPPEWPEWGNPLEDVDAYDYIASYSPYDNVEVRRYPAILVTAGLTDPRVTYWEPAKWVARLRRCNIGSQPLLLKTNMDAGHGGAAGRFEQLREVALMYAFILKILMPSALRPEPNNKGAAG